MSTTSSTRPASDQPTRTELDWLRSWERSGSRAAAAPDDPGAQASLASLTERLDEFGRGLPPGEQAALALLVDRARQPDALRRLAELPPETVLTDDEVAVFDALCAEPIPDQAVLRPQLNVVMKATRLCNLRCTYCNYWREGPGQVMSFEVLARLLHDVLVDPGVERVEFIWHGGEPTLLGTEWFRKAFWLQQQFRRPGQVVANRTQTNATRLEDDFIDFWKEHDVIVGVSLDGPPEVHDRRRVDRVGRPTAARARSGLERLQSAGLEPRVLLVCDEDVLEVGAQRVLAYLLELGVERVGLLNVVPENTVEGVSEGNAYLAWPRYVAFLTELFDLWWPAHVADINLRELADLAGQLLGGPPQICNFAGDCFGSVFTVEPDGRVAACDRYVNVAAKSFGSVAEQTFRDLVLGERLAAVATAERVTSRATEECRWRHVCHGGCPHDRDLSSAFVPGWESSCCGLGPLLDHLAASMTEGGSELDEPSSAARSAPPAAPPPWYPATALAPVATPLVATAPVTLRPRGPAS
ncbi:MAG: radical SAM protein [Acidimicrobiales bacterium]|jgi:uncharacterized protein|nr:radical SAM protein [Acidimicrobiales bacterium]